MIESPPLKSLGAAEPTAGVESHANETEANAFITPEAVRTLINRLNAAELELVKANAFATKARNDSEKLASLCEIAPNSNDLHSHFKLAGHWHWLAIAEEGQRVVEKLSNKSVEDGSVLQSALCGVAGQARYGAYAAVAAMLRVDADALQAIALAWEESQECLPAPISFNDLQDKIKCYQLFSRINE